MPDPDPQAAEALERSSEPYTWGAFNVFAEIPTAVDPDARALLDLTAHEPIGELLDDMAEHHPDEYACLAEHIRVEEWRGARG